VHAGVMDNPRHVRRKVVQMAVAPGFQLDLFLINHALLLRATAAERNAIFRLRFWFLDISDGIGDDTAAVCQRSRMRRND